MSEGRVENWLLALRDHLPEQIEELRAEVEDLERQKADRMALIHDYTDLLSIARRRQPLPPTTEPTTRPA